MRLRDLWRRALEPNDPPATYEAVVRLQMRLLRELHLVTCNLARLESHVGNISHPVTATEASAMREAAEWNKQFATVLETVIKGKDPAGKW